MTGESPPQRDSAATVSPPAKREGADGKAREPGDLPPTESPQALVERGGFMIKASPARTLVATAASLAVSLALCSSALALPVTVHLRVEGTNATVFDGNVTTDARTISAPDPPKSPGPPGPANPHPCDVKDNGSSPAGSYGTAYGTPTTALYDATNALGFNAYWYSSFNDFFINGIGSDNTGNWTYAVNFTTAGVGGCEFQLAPSSDVLWAANGGTAAHLLKLDGPNNADVGSPTVFRVTDGQNGQPVSGAAVADATTDASGNATVTFLTKGTQTLKASRGDSVRSAALGVCVHSGNDGTCGTTAPSPSLPGGLPAPTVKRSPRPSAAPLPRILGLRNHQRFARGHAPRSLRVRVSVPSGSSLRQVRIRLERRVRGRCLYLDGRSERFRRHRCGHGAFFAVGDRSSLSYLLPQPLTRGNYVFDVQALDAGGRPTGLIPGVSHVVFDVR